MNQFTFTADDTIKVIAALGTLAAVLGGIVINAIVAWKTKAKVADIKEETKVQTSKLQNIEVLVDGRYSAVLQELADVKRLLANSSGLAHHAENADIAQTIANEQESRVDMLKDSSSHLHPLTDRTLIGEIPNGPTLDVPLMESRKERVEDKKKDTKGKK